MERIQHQPFIFLIIIFPGIIWLEIIYICLYIYQWKMLVAMLICGIFCTSFYIFDIEPSSLTVQMTRPNQGVQEANRYSSYNILSCSTEEAPVTKHTNRWRNKDLEKKSLCSSSATERGPGQKVISYVIFGSPDDSRVFNDHFINILALTERAKKVFDSEVFESQTLFRGLESRTSVSSGIGGG